MKKQATAPSPQQSKRGPKRGPNRLRLVEAHRLIKAAREAKLAITGVEVDPSGVIRVLAGQPGAANKSELDDWIEQKHHANPAQGTKQQA